MPSKGEGKRDKVRDGARPRNSHDSGESKAKKEKVRDPQAWEDDEFPTMEQREIVEAQFNPEELRKMRDNTRRKLMASKGVDPATLTRRWDISLAVTGIENASAFDWEVFLAVTMGTSSDNRGRKKLHQRFVYTRSYVVPKNQKKQFKSIELVFSKKWDGSYKDLVQQEIFIDVWLVSKTSFNQILGTAQKSLYNMGCESVYQTMMIRPTGGKGAAFDGVVYLNAVVCELFEFTIVASNWQFQPNHTQKSKPENAKKSLSIAMPTGRGEPIDVQATIAVAGPWYRWPLAGTFVYNGTSIGLSMEAVNISVYTDGKLQGKAVVSLGVAGEYPVVIGTVKQLSQRVEDYVQGQVGGSLTVSTKSSVSTKSPVVEADSSIPPPLQPPDSLILNYLTPGLQYLVVELQGATGLPIADADYGSSNAFARVKYDGMVQQSPVVYGSLSPTWNHTFYFPVRVTDERIKDNPYKKKLLPEEMKSKGFLEIEAWHFDSVPTEFLGGFKLDLQKTRYGEEMEKSLCSKVTRAKTPQDPQIQGNDDEIGSIGIHPALSKKERTKVYGKGRRETLGSSWLQSATRATVSFECYFWPDVNCNIPEQPANENNASNERDHDPKKWWPDFLEAYSGFFPDAPTKRLCLVNYTEAGGRELPLPMLIIPLALPEALALPMKVQHWIRCMEFYVPPRQRSLGQIKNWQRPEDTLALRRGSVQDHAVLLCCALLGLGKMAYVCKGTVQGGKDHAWVMTQEKLGCVTFWETTTGGKFHLPGRWLANSDNRSCAQQISERWKTRCKNKNSWKGRGKGRREWNRAQHLEHMRDLEDLPISPWKELYQKEENIVPMPYESIEFVFNGRELWINSGNHNPGCIFYDMGHDSSSWVPLLESTVCENRGVAIPVGPSVSKSTAESIQDAVEAEIKECMRFVRINRGHESYFEDDEVLQATLEGYLNMLEIECQLDSDWCYNSDDKQVKPWAAPSPFNAFNYVTKCREQWSKYWKDKKQMDHCRRFLPVKENHVLSGIPVHISSTDLKEIRKNLMNCTPLQEYFNIASDEVLFFVCAKVTPMPSSVNSVWIFLGAEVPLSRERVEELALLNKMRTEVSEPAQAGGRASGRAAAA